MNVHLPEVENPQKAAWEDTFVVPDELRNSPRVARALEVVTHKYLFYICAASQYAKLGAPNALRLVYAKLLHTNDVIKAATEAFEPGNGASLEDVTLAAIFHDLFRALQGWFCLDYSDGRSGLDHGEAAADYMVDVLKYSPDDPLVLAVREHSKLHLSETNNTYIAKITKDIDKIGIVRGFISMYGHITTVTDELLNWDDLDENVKAPYRKTTHLQKNELTPQVLEYLQNHQPIPSQYRNTELDDVILKIAWMWDLFYQKTRAVFAHDALPEMMICYIEVVLKPSPEILTCLQKNVLEWYETFQLGQPNYRKGRQSLRVAFGLPARPNSRRKQSPRLSLRKR